MHVVLAVSNAAFMPDVDGILDLSFRSQQKHSKESMLFV